MNWVKKANSGEKEAKAQVALIDKALTELNEGRPARRADVDADERKAWNMLQLLTAAWSADLFHRRADRIPRVDDPRRLDRAASRRRHSRRFRKRLHPR